MSDNNVVKRGSEPMTEEEKKIFQERKVGQKDIIKIMGTLCNYSVTDIKAVLDITNTMMLESLRNDESISIPGLASISIEKRKPKRHWDNVKRCMVVSEGKYYMAYKMDPKCAKEINAIVDYETTYEASKSFYETQAVLRQQQRKENGK